MLITHSTAEQLSNTGVFKRLKDVFRQGLLRLGYSVKRIRAEDARYFYASYDSNTPVPDAAFRELVVTNPKLQRLRERYRSLNIPVTRHTIWSEKKLSRELTLPWFRGDNAYVWQFRQMGG